MSADCTEANQETKPRPYYEDDFATIYHGDCEEVVATFDANQFDLAFADPPYNYGVAYDGYADNQHELGYQLWCSLWFRALRSVAKKVIVTPGHGNLVQWMERKPSGVGCWYKPGSPASSHLGWCEWEPWLYWGQRLGGSDTLRVPFVSNLTRTELGHPCPKPVELLSKLLVKTKATTVLDPFLGSGTTLVAAKALGLRAVGIEQSERYCEVAARRLSQGVLDFDAPPSVVETSSP